jgi:hypothetical protein
MNKRVVPAALAIVMLTTASCELYLDFYVNEPGSGSGATTTTTATTATSGTTGGSGTTTSSSGSGGSDAGMTSSAGGGGATSSSGSGGTSSSSGSGGACTLGIAPSVAWSDEAANGYVQAIATDPQGNVLVTGQFTGSIDFGLGELSASGASTKRPRPS